MKKTLLFAALLLLGLTAGAQTLNVHQGVVSFSIPAASAGTMTYADGASLTIAGRTYAVSALDSIVVDDSEVVNATVRVRYDGAAATVNVSGDIAPYITAEVSGAHVVVTAAPELEDEVTYVLSGSSSDGSFTQNGSWKCTVELAGLQLASQQGAAIDIENGKRINILLADGTENTLSDAAAGLQKACLFVKGHAEFSGGGALRLTGKARHAYASNEYTQLKKSFVGTLSVLGAASDGLHVEQYFLQQGGSVSISGCGGDGVDVAATTDATDEQNGQLLIAGGSISVSLGAAEDVKGLKCDSTLTISGGTVSITGSGDGVKGLKSGTDLLINESSGNATTVTVNVTGTTYHKGETDESKTRGMKVNGDFTFDGGTIRVTATGSKAKAIVVDGTYYYKRGDINCSVDATNVG